MSYTNTIMMSYTHTIKRFRVWEAKGSAKVYKSASIIAKKSMY
jgi:hypothetical protein